MPITQYQRDVADLLSLFAKCAKPTEIIDHLKRTNKRGESLAQQMATQVYDQWTETVDLPMVLRGYIKLGHSVTAVLDLLEMSSEWGANIYHAVCSRHHIEAYDNWMYLLLEMLDHSQPKSEKVAERIYGMLSQQACYASNLQSFYKPIEAMQGASGVYDMMLKTYFEVVYELACNHLTRSQCEVLLQKNNQSLEPQFVKFVDEQGDDYKSRILATGIWEKPIAPSFFNTKIREIAAVSNPIKLLFGISE